MLRVSDFEIVKWRRNALDLDENTKDWYIRRFSRLHSEYIKHCLKERLSRPSVLDVIIGFEQAVLYFGYEFKYRGEDIIPIELYTEILEEIETLKGGE